MAEPLYLFVYGTLRPPRAGTAPDASYNYPHVAEYVLEVHPARVSGAELYDCGPYPAARPGEGLLHGELLLVEPAALEITDRIEGHPRLYRRECVAVQTDRGSVEAWVYWASEALTAGRERIQSGDWFERPGGDLSRDFD
ncbi:MAG: gamma-glutamylcyclotransferase [Anaerolineales bacterium]